MSVPQAVKEFFPYEFRPYQDLFSSRIYDALSRQKSICLEAVTGLGKTVASLSSAIPIALEKGLTILFCTRTHRQVDRVMEEMKIINSYAPRKLRGVAIYGKQHLCLHRSVKGAKYEQAMKICEYLHKIKKCDYLSNFVRIYAKYLDMLKKGFFAEAISAREIISYGIRDQVCPYELALLLAQHANIIALTYNYALDPALFEALLRRLRKKPEEIIFIFDEAHNIPKIATEIASFSLLLQEIQEAKKEAVEVRDESISALLHIMTEFINKSKVGKGEEELFDARKLIKEIEEGIGCHPSGITKLLDLHAYAIQEKRMKEGKIPYSMLHKISLFIKNLLSTSDQAIFKHFISIRSEDPLSEPEPQLKIVPLDPKVATYRLSQAYSNICFSGTLEPIDLFMQIIGLPEDSEKVTLPCPYPEENFIVLAQKGLTTKGLARTSDMYYRLKRRILEVIKHTPGNVGVFCASFDVLDGLRYAGLMQDLEELGKSFYYEQRGMTSEENYRILRKFKQDKEKGAVLLAVSGGRSSEGVDYPGREMIASVIVGVPYIEPSPSVLEGERYFNKVFRGKGKDIALTIPAIQKASHSAGRPLRSLDDVGAIIFLDYRFTTSYCRRFLPRWIRERMKILPDEDFAIAKELTSFFARNYHKLLRLK